MLCAYSLMSVSFAVIVGTTVVSASLQLAIAVAMWRRRLYRRMPWFFAYTLWIMTFSLVMLSFYLRVRVDPGFQPTSYYVGWSQEAVSVALGFAVVYEVFVQVFQPYEAFHRVGKALFRWCGVGLLLLGSAVSLLASPFGPDPAFVQLTAGIVVVERTVRVVEVGLLLVVLVAVRYMGVSWRRDTLGVAVGLGMYAATSMVCLAQQAQNGPLGYYVLGMVSGTAYTCAVMIWAAYILVRQPAAEPVRHVPQDTETEQWNQALSHLLQR